MSATITTSRNTKLQARCHSKILEILPLLTTDEHNLSLMTGKAGSALTYAYAYQHYKDPKYLEHLNFLVDNILDEIGHYPSLQSLCGGWAGIGYLLHQLIEMDLLDADLDELLGEINYLLHRFRHLKEPNGFVNYDYLHGAVGIGFYFLTIGKHEPALQLMQDLINSREEISDTIWRFTFYNSTMETYSYNLGLAHGLPSYLIYAAKCYKICTDNAFKSEIERFLHNALNYIESQKLPTDGEHYSLYHNGITLGKEVESIHSSRLGWCYGDLGIATAYWLAGEALESETYKEKAIDIMLHTTKRIRKEETNVMDYTLCHGTVGIAMIYRLFYQRTDNQVFKNAYYHWLERTLDLATFEDGLAGYKRYVIGSWESSTGLLEGVAGIAFAFLQELEEDPSTSYNLDFLFLS
ncbi:MAG: hypothetical protein RLZZ292_2348 [Bacteroidota bacterium]|jgi:lantibiotic modifying enzyme